MQHIRVISHFYFVRNLNNLSQENKIENALKSEFRTKSGIKIWFCHVIENSNRTSRNVKSLKNELKFGFYA